MEIDKKIYNYISGKIGKIITSNKTPNDIYWYMWGKIKYLIVNQKIDALGYQILMNKLTTFIEYLENQ